MQAQKKLSCEDTFTPIEDAKDTYNIGHIDRGVTSKQILALEKIQKKAFLSDLKKLETLEKAGFTEAEINQLNLSLYSKYQIVNLAIGQKMAQKILGREISPRQALVLISQTHKVEQFLERLRNPGKGNKQNTTISQIFEKLEDIGFTDKDIIKLIEKNWANLSIENLFEGQAIAENTLGREVSSGQALGLFFLRAYGYTHTMEAEIKNVSTLKKLGFTQSEINQFIESNNEPVNGFNILLRLHKGQTLAKKILDRDVNPNQAKALYLLQESTTSDYTVHMKNIVYLKTLGFTEAEINQFIDKNNSIYETGGLANLQVGRKLAKKAFGEDKDISPIQALVLFETHLRIKSKSPKARVNFLQENGYSREDIRTLARTYENFRDLFKAM